MDLIGEGTSGYVGEKTRFPTRSMKTKSEFWRYPRKISLLKGLWKGISLDLVAGMFWFAGLCAGVTLISVWKIEQGKPANLRILYLEWNVGRGGNWGREGA